MQKLILLLFIPILFTCSSNDDPNEDECLSNEDLIGTWYSEDGRMIVFEEETFAYYTFGESYYNNPNERNYCLLDNIMHVNTGSSINSIDENYLEIVNYNSFLFEPIESPRLFIRGEDYIEPEIECIYIELLQNKIATPINNEEAPTYIFFDDGTVQWGIENKEQFTDNYCIYFEVLTHGDVASWLAFDEFTYGIIFPSFSGDDLMINDVFYNLEDL